jgi:hypothetical protein
MHALAGNSRPCKTRPALVHSPVLSIEVGYNKDKGSYVIKQTFKLLLLLSFLIVGCQTHSPIQSGIQTGFQAVNPAAIIAVPIFIMPDPSSETSLIDPSLIITEKLIPVLENKVMDSFNGQPNINGYQFSAVKKAMGSHPNVWDNLDAAMKTVAKRFSSRDVKTRLLITPNCLVRKNFIEFYSYCLADESAWLTNLNSLSAKVLNADTALITVITDLEDKVVDKKYQVTGGIAILLVDTNNGKLIWGNYKKETLIDTEDKKNFPSWKVLLDKILVPDFWQDFPGRIGKNQLNIKEDK